MLTLHSTVYTSMYCTLYSVQYCRQLGRCVYSYSVGGERCCVCSTVITTCLQRRYSFRFQLSHNQSLQPVSFSSEQPPLPAQKMLITPGPRSFAFSTCCGVKYFTFPSYLWSSACAAHLIIWQRWTAVYQNSFYPVTGLPMKRTAVTPTAYYPVTLVTAHCFFC